ncbi:MAG TPA: AMP-binding protein [Gaiella sp.]
MQANAATLGGRTAVECGDVRLGHDELADLTSRLADGLASVGVGRGDCVVILLPNSPEYLVSFLALAALGAGAVLLDPGSKEYELHLAFADCRPRAVIADQRGAGRCRAVADELGLETTIVAVGAEPSGAVAMEELLRAGGRRDAPGSLADEPLLYQYSSGSTGRSKRVARTQAQCVAETQVVRETLALTPEDTILCAVPLFHAYGFGDCFLAALGSGAKLKLQAQVQPFAVRRSQTMELIERHRVTVFPAVPYMVDLLASAPGAGDLSSLRFCFTAGTALPVDTAAAFQARFGVPARQLYGCTESPSIAANLDEDPAATATSVGRPFAGVKVVIHDDEGALLPPGETGEIGISSPVASSGYVGETYGDHVTFRDGWVFPGDLGVLDGDGRLTIVGRTKLFIDVHGHKVDPLEVEDVLVQHPAVAEVVVVGAEDRRRQGTVVKAAVVAGAPCTEREIIHFCKERLALFKVPQVVEFRESIPRSPLGKVLRKELVQ